jgi:hypothetical protein
LILQFRNFRIFGFQKDLVLESRLTVFGSVFGLPTIPEIDKAADFARLSRG